MPVFNGFGLSFLWLRRKETSQSGNGSIDPVCRAFVSKRDLRGCTLFPDAQCNAAIRDLLSAAGLSQAMRKFDADTVLMNPSFERDTGPSALNDLLDSLVVSCSCRLAALATHKALRP